MRKKQLSLLCVRVCFVALATFTVGCQTTRRPSAIRSADNSALLVQVSQDPSSLMWNEGRFKSSEALKQPTAAVKSPTDTVALQTRAELSLLGHMTRSASENARAILRHDMRNVKALKSLIKAALIERKPHEALLLTNSAMSVAPQDAELFSYEALAQYQLDNPLYAKALWNKALSLDPLHIPTLMNLGVFLFQNGHSKKAGAHFDRVLALQPQHLDAQVGRALVLSAEGSHDDAVSALEAILKKTGDNALVLENLALISRERLKDYKKASRYVERTLALRSADRRSIETAVGMRQELRRLMAGQEKRLTDENLREMAETPAAEAGEGSGSGSQGGSAELQKMEDSIK